MGVPTLDDHSAPPEFLALILAATAGARLYPLASVSHPKHLFPVAGITLLVRQLRVLAATDFSECVIALAHSDKHTANSLKEVEGIQQLTTNSFQLNKSLKLTLHHLPENCSGSLQALRNVDEASIIPPSSHVVIIPGDLVVTDISVLKNLANTHRRCSSEEGEKTACTMLLADVGEEDENGIPLKESSKAKKNGFSREEDQIEYIALSLDNTPRVVWKQSKIDVEEDEDMVGTSPKLILPKPRLRSGARVRTDWYDVHVYVLSPWIRHLCAARSSLVSLQGDLIPLLVDSQFQGVESAFGDQSEAKEAFGKAFPEGDESFSVRANVFNGSKVMRACTLPAYLVACRDTVSQVISGNTEASAMLPKDANVNSKFNSIVLKDVRLGDKNQIKSSVVGSGTKFGAKCKLNNVVIMNNATIGDNVILQNAVLGEGCVIGDNCSLSYVRVAHGKEIVSGTKEKGDLFMDEI